MKTSQLKTLLKSKGVSEETLNQVILEIESKRIEKSSKRVEKYRDYDWKKIPVGSTFRACIGGVWCEGKIQKERWDIFLCQNKKDGAICKNKLGYNYSWSIYTGGLDDLKLRSVNVTYLQVWLP